MLQTGVCEKETEKEGQMERLEEKVGGREEERNEKRGGGGKRWEGEKYFQRMKNRTLFAQLTFCPSVFNYHTATNIQVSTRIPNA